MHSLFQISVKSNILAQTNFYNFQEQANYYNNKTLVQIFWGAMDPQQDKLGSVTYIYIYIFWFILSYPKFT